MIPDKESWCDSLIPIVILEAIDMIRNQLRTPRSKQFNFKKTALCISKEVAPVSNPGIYYNCYLLPYILYRLISQANMIYLYTYYYPVLSLSWGCRPA